MFVADVNVYVKTLSGQDRFANFGGAYVAWLLAPDFYFYDGVSGHGSGLALGE
jgi:hypothetical protein